MSIAKLVVAVVGLVCVAVTVNYEVKAKKLRQNRNANINKQVREMEAEYNERDPMTDVVHDSVVTSIFRKAV